MATRDYITPEYKLSHKGIISLDEFYRAVKNCANVHRYDILELEYKTLKLAEGDVTSISWLADKTIDDYRRARIDIEMSFSNLQRVTKKDQKGVFYECTINFMCRGYLVEDYEEQVSATPVKHFLRAVYEKFINKSKVAQIENMIKGDTKKVADEVKSFFRLY